MTTHRPTGAELPTPDAANDGAAQPVWLPDEALLNRLAGEFFSALPSGAPGVATLGTAEPDLGSMMSSSPVPPQGSMPHTGSVASTMGSTPSAGPSIPSAGSPMSAPPRPPAGSATESTLPLTGSPIPPTGSSLPSTGRSMPSTGSASSPPRSAAQSGGIAPTRGTAPPGGQTPEPSVPDWGPEVPMSGASSAAPDTGVHIDPFLPMLPSLDGLLSPPRFADTSSAPSTAPAFYFLERPDPAVAQPSSPFYFLDDAPIAPDPHPPFDVYAVRNDFPILRERVNGYPLVWFDNAATTQKPRAVIERLSYFYEHENSNIHRAAHELAARSTDAYERARDAVARFLGASSAEEIIFVRGATEGLNLIAQTWGRKNIRAGDEILISQLEHHANIVPWQLLAAETGAELRVIPVDDRGQLLMDEYTRLLSDRTKLVSVAHVSNALGTITPVHEIVAQAHRAGAVTVVDGAQSVPHTTIDVRSIGADFFVFSGHKLFGPTGIGAVYGKSEVLQDVPPWQGGGNMISDVTMERSLFQPPPGRFEAGTGSIADAVGLGSAIEYVEAIGMANIARYEHDLLAYATPRLAAIPGVRLIGTAADKASVLSFVMAGHQPVEVGKALNEKGIAVRAGHHCAQPILRRFGLEATIRPSFAFYNTCEEIDRMLAALEQLSRARM
ncbi:family 2A encapsulin nanocompartment cargo protein cysteine desulfurase [Nocardia sp. NPDC052566]|uniref:family 2A encapsulin nanocompartment cargo protein cysteine desulfurase n=1 Tax=Nocardia sp. NPDC052566 TaxID=3364330 RepID=UPI0037C7DC22